MPISNPLLTINPYRSAVLLESSDPIAAPLEEKTFWLNLVTRKLWLAIATNSLSDWIAVGGDSVGSVEWTEVSNKPDTFPSTWLAVSNKPETFPVDIASILNKILVQDGEILTTEDNIIFED